MPQDPFPEPGYDGEEPDGFPLPPAEVFASSGFVTKSTTQSYAKANVTVSARR